MAKKRKAARLSPGIRVAGCPCHRMMRVLTKLGAHQAAVMEAAGMAENVEEWTNHDVLVHFDEEERFLGPFLPPAVTRQLIAQHDYFRDQIRNVGAVNSEEFKKHARWEDGMVAKYFPND